MTLRSWTVLGAILSTLLWPDARALRTPATAAVAPAPEPPAAAVPDRTEPRVFSPLIARRVISTPPGAELLRHGAVLGRTPIELELTPSNEAVPVTLRLAGYLEQTFALVPDQPETTFVVLKRGAPEAPDALAGRGEP